MLIWKATACFLRVQLCRCWKQGNLISKTTPLKLTPSVYTLKCESNHQLSSKNLFSLQPVSGRLVYFQCRLGQFRFQYRQLDAMVTSTIYLSIIVIAAIVFIIPSEVPVMTRTGKFQGWACSCGFPTPCFWGMLSWIRLLRSCHLWKFAWVVRRP